MAMIPETMQLVERGVSLAHGLWVVHLVRKKAFQKLSPSGETAYPQPTGEGKKRDWSQK